MADDHPVRELIQEVEELEQEALPPEPALPSLTVPEISSGRIFLFLICFYASAFLIRALFLHGPGIAAMVKYFLKPSAQIHATGSMLYDFFLYMCFAFQFFPLPTIPAIAFAAKLFHPVVISAIGSAGTCIANLNDYAILGWLFRSNRVKKVRDIKSYRRLLTFFDRYAFLTLSAAAFLPIPIDVIRLLAISRAYSYSKYVAATFVGRFPRYLILAYLGKQLPAKYILLLFFLLSLPALVKIGSDMMKKRRRA